MKLGRWCPTGNLGVGALLYVPNLSHWPHSTCAGLPAYLPSGPFSADALFAKLPHPKRVWAPPSHSTYSSEGVDKPSGKWELAPKWVSEGSKNLHKSLNRPLISEGHPVEYHSRIFQTVSEWKFYKGRPLREIGPGPHGEPGPSVSEEAPPHHRICCEHSLSRC
jgi:hypothetical protein